MNTKPCEVCGVHNYIHSTVCHSCGNAINDVDPWFLRKVKPFRAIIVCINIALIVSIITTAIARQDTFKGKLSDIGDNFLSYQLDSRISDVFINNESHSITWKLVGFEDMFSATAKDSRIKLNTLAMAVNGSLSEIAQKSASLTNIANVTKQPFTTKSDFFDNLNAKQGTVAENVLRVVRLVERLYGLLSK